MKKLTIIPVYNEERAISKILKRFPEGVVDKIVVVNDGSTDSTCEELESFKRECEEKIHIIDHKKNLGVGASIRDGINYAIENNFDIIVVLAGNGKDDPAEIPKLITPIIAEGYDYVQGSRFLEGGRYDNLPLHRYIAIRLYSLCWTWALGHRITDVSNGFRAYRTSIFQDKRINIWQDWLSRYELELYLHYKVITLGYRFKEVPVSKIYPISGKYTKIRPVIDWWRLVKPFIYLKLGIKS